MPGKIAVLVVEDEPLIRLDIVDQLLDDGYEVFEAANADQAGFAPGSESFNPHPFH